MTTKVIEGCGVGVVGYEDDYLVIDGTTCGASGMLPEQVGESVYHAITYRHADTSDSNFWRRQYATRVGDNPLPTVYRVKITVESEPLTQAESDAWWAAREREHRGDDDGVY